MRTLPKVYAQRDPAWTAQRLGTVNGSTIGQYGCYITSFAMLACYYGHYVTPAQLDNIFTNDPITLTPIYVNGDLCPDNGLQQAFADCVFQKAYDFTHIPADLNVLKDLLADPTTSVILELDFDHNPNDGQVQAHFVVAVDCDGQKVTIADPWYAGVAPFSQNYGLNPSETILRFVVYKGTPASSAAPTGGANMYKGLDLNNSESMKVCVDVFTDLQAGVYIKKTDADSACTAKLGDQQIALSTATETIKTYVANQNQILQLLGLKTTDGQPEIVGAINGILSQEQKFNDANAKILELQGQIEADASAKQKAVDDMQKQIDDLETKQITDIQTLKTQQTDEIAQVRASCTTLGTQVSATISTQQTVTLIQRILNFFTLLK